MPATCSRAIVSGLLRHELEFRGVIVSDDMEMGAIRDRDVDGAAAVEAIGAGCDLLLYCSDLERGLTAVAAIAIAVVKKPHSKISPAKIPSPTAETTAGRINPGMQPDSYRTSRCAGDAANSINPRCHAGDYCHAITIAT